MPIQNGLLITTLCASSSAFRPNSVGGEPMRNLPGATLQNRIPSEFSKDGAESPMSFDRSSKSSSETWTGLGGGGVVCLGGAGGAGGVGGDTGFASVCAGRGALKCL